MNDLVLKEVMKHTNELSDTLKSDERERISIGDFLVAPYVRTFEHPHDAKQYSDKLKAQILPNIKEVIDSYRNHTAAQTIEF